ncbi:MAG TPA: hypothetical protein VFU02_20180 [Polyangiaceae bacterium]|nr:hypothetical protein [Polyangiaceae bacterium]
MRVHLLACASLLAFAPSALAQEAPPAAPPPSNLEAGGLRPPEAVEPEQPVEQPPGDAQVETQLEKAESEDTGRGLEFVWLNGEVGYQTVGLQTLSDGDLVDGTLIENNQSGPVFGGGLGVRLFVITLGARFRYGSFDAWDMWSVNAEGAFHIPLGKLDLYFALGAGYVSLGGFKSDTADASAGLSDLAVSGFNVRAGVGMDYYFSNTFSVGLNLGGEILMLSRSALDVPSDSPESLAIYAEDGSGVGAAFTPTAVVGLHF